MSSIFLLLGSLSAMIGVGVGAFGAHALKAILSAESLAVYQTGVTYQMWHSLGLFGIGLLHQQQPRAKLVPWAGWLMFVGILLFSGSLYALTLTGLRWLGMITPVGGVCFLLAWLFVCLSVNNKKPSRYQ